MKEHCNKSAADHCDSYPFCWGCNAFTGNEEEIQKQLDEFFEKTPYKVTFDSDRLKHGKVFHENSIANVWYDSESDEVEVDYVSGEKERYKRTSLKLVEADEREIATEEDYLIEPNLHVIFYPEGWMSNYYIE